MRSSLAVHAVLGSTTPRLWTRPLVAGPAGPCGCGCALTPKTSFGFSVVDFAREIGFEPLPWQRWLWIHGLELLPDRRFRFRKLIILVARQQGKTSCVEIKNLWKMFVQRAQILGTAQDLDVSEESWDNAVAICEAIPELRAEIADVIKVNGKKALKLNNGARWKVKAANRKGGRGFAVDDVGLDELREHQTWKPWSAVTKTTIARPNYQIWGYSNAGDDSSIVLNDLQATARLTVERPEIDLTLGLFEWSAPDGTRCTCGRVKPEPHSDACPLTDPALLAMANPSLGYTVELEALLSASKTDPDEEFLTECMCVHVKTLSGGVIPEALWEARKDVASEAVGWVGLGVDASPKLASAAVAMVGYREDGKRHWQLLRHDAGSDWVAGYITGLGLNHVGVGVDPAGPAGALIPALQAAKVKVVDVTGRTLVQAWGSFDAAVREDGGCHLGQQAVADAIKDASTPPSGDVEKFSRRKSTGDISPLVALTVADHVLCTEPPPADPWVMWD